MSSRVSRTTRTLLGGLALSLSLAATPADAQCFGPDNLSFGPCCGFTTANLPPFPPITLPSMGVCWSNCTVAGTEDMTVSWSPPSPTSCARYISQLSITDAAGINVLSGLMQLEYTRTWEEVDPTGAATQVWRFAVKADLNAIAGVFGSPCTTPSCLSPAGPYPTAFYYGYVDYSSCSGFGPWDAVLVLEHQCDTFIHTPGFSDRPGVFHPNRSYAIVAPHSAVQPFIPMNQMAPSGPIFAEAVRAIDNSTPPPNACYVEDRVIGGLMQKLGVVCICIPATSPKQQTLRDFSGQTFCSNAAGIPGAWATINLYPTTPWFHMVTTSIGAWSTGNVYPGKESVWVDEGLFVHQEACTGDFVEVKYGATTKDGWNVTTPGLTQSFTDLVDNWSAPLGGPYLLPLYGSVQQSDRLIYINTP